MKWVYLFSKAFRPSFLPKYSCVYWVTERLFYPGVQRSWCAADSSPPFSCWVKNQWSYTYTPLIYLRGLQSNRFTFHHYDIPLYILCDVYNALPINKASQSISKFFTSKYNVTNLTSHCNWLEVFCGVQLLACFSCFKDCDKENTDIS